jgi:predicted HTH transcriptional regulator
MPTLKELLVAEATEYEFKSTLETSRPKSWLKTVSAYANGQGGSFFYGVNDDGTVIGLDNVKKTTEQISKLIQARILPLPEFNLTPHRLEDGKIILILKIFRGETPPYYYVADGNTIAYVRVGDESVPVSPQQLSELARRGKNLTFDSMPTEYKVTDLTFTVFNATFKRIKKLVLTEKEYVSFGICKPDGKLTYAGLMFADECRVIGSEVHVDMFDDRLEIYSPGGMPDGTLIQERDIEEVPSTRRNPIISEMFHRLDFVERRGSGLKKIRNETADLYGYTDEFAPMFKSTRTAFHVTLKNMNYDLRADLTYSGQVTGQVTGQDNRAEKLLEYCNTPRTQREMQEFIVITSREYFNKTVLLPLLESGKLKMTIPDKPNSRNQKYVRA